MDEGKISQEIYMEKITLVLQGVDFLKRVNDENEIS